MSTIDVAAENVEKMLMATNDVLFRRCERAAVNAASRLIGYLRQMVDDLGINDTGGYRAGFRRDGSTVINDAPHAGIIELGARPHPVSKEGVLAIAAWVRRKLHPKDESGSVIMGKNGKPKKFGEDAALRIAYAIAENIKKFGQKPHYVMMNALPQAREFFDAELNALNSSEDTGRKAAAEVPGG